MNWLVIVIAAYIASYGASAFIDKLVDKKYFKDYEKIATEKNINWEKLQAQIFHEQNQFLDKSWFWKYVPGLNILIALKRAFIRPYRVAWIRKNTVPVIPGMVPKYIIEQQRTGVKEKYEEKKSYFIGKKLADKNLIIYFYFDGHDIILYDASIAEFKEFPFEEQTETLMHMLYDLYLGNDSDMQRSDDIYEIFNQMVIHNLVETFENNNKYYEVNEEPYDYNQEGSMRKRTRKDKK